MVRLQEDDVPPAAESGGKRSRPVSSLDYKADPAGERKPLVADTAGSTTSQHRKPPPPPLNTEPVESSGGGNSKDRQNMYTTRARGSGGIPQRPLSLQDLGGMTQDQTMEALRNDPALAAELHAATEQQQQQQQGGGGSSRRSAESAFVKPGPDQLSLKDLEGMTQEQIMEALRSNPALAAKLEALATEQQQGGGGSSRRSSDSTFVKPGDRSDLLKQQGVPYQQWGILLFLLGIGLYQLYKSLKSPVVTNSKGAATPKKGAKQRNSAKPVVQSQTDDDEVVAALQSSVAKGASSTAAKKPKKKKQTSSTKSAQKAAIAETAPASPIRAKKPQQQPAFEEPQDEDEGEWMTVGNTSVLKSSANPVEEGKPANDAATVLMSNTTKTKKKNGAAATAPPPPPPPSPPPPAIVEETFTPVVQELKTERLSETEQVAKAETNGSSSDPAFEVPAPMNGSSEPAAGAPKRKKIKKKKEKSDDASPIAPTNGSSHTDADAALAQQLQQEEDKLVRQQDAEAHESAAAAAAISSSEPEADDVWAEVTKKKKQPKTDAAETE